MISPRLAKQLKMVTHEDGSLSYGDFSFTQPAKPMIEKPALKPATYKDVKLVYDKIRLHTWCENIKFTLVTPGTFLEFNDMQVEFVTKSKQLALQSKLRDVNVGGKQLVLPACEPIRLLHGESISISCLLRTNAAALGSE